MPRYDANLPVSIFKEGDAFVAWAPTLDLSTCGKTMEEAQKQMGEAIELFIEELARMGTMDAALYELGWTKLKQSWKPPTEVSHRIETVRLPA